LGGPGHPDRFFHFFLGRDFLQAERSRRRAQTNWRFLRAFRKAAALDAVMVASEQNRPSPLVSVFDFGYEEVERQVKARGRLSNRTALERALQLGVSEEVAKLERNMHWLAITASVSPFIGLLGTVLGIIRTFNALGQQGATSLAAVGPGISEALDRHRAGPVCRHSRGTVL
jgi:biopolymer transport protein TolQ